MENLFHPTCIRTWSGRYVDPLDPDPGTILVEDIAHALSHQCRFGGHLPMFYSVAEHSLLVSEFVAPEHKLAALMHDASEAYLLDIPSPVKHRLPGYKEAEDQLMRVIAAKFNFPWPLPAEVKAADTRALQVEWDDIMLRGQRPVFSANRPKQDFLNMFNKLKG